MSPHPFFYGTGQGKGHPSPAPHPENQTQGRLHRRIDTPAAPQAPATTIKSKIFGAQANRRTQDRNPKKCPRPSRASRHRQPPSRRCSSLQSRVESLRVPPFPVKRRPITGRQKQTLPFLPPPPLNSFSGSSPFTAPNSHSPPKFHHSLSFTLLLKYTRATLHHGRPCPGPNRKAASSSARRSAPRLSAPNVLTFRPSGLQRQTHQPTNFPLITDASPVVSYSCRLFVVPKKVISFGIRQIHTLSRKHPGGGTSAHPRQPSLPSSYAPRGASIPCTLSRLRILPVATGV